MGDDDINVFKLIDFGNVPLFEDVWVDNWQSVSRHKQIELEAACKSITGDKLWYWDTVLRTNRTHEYRFSTFNCYKFNRDPPGGYRIVCMDKDRIDMLLANIDKRVGLMSCTGLNCDKLGMKYPKNEVVKKDFCKRYKEFLATGSETKQIMLCDQCLRAKRLEEISKGGLDL